MFKPRVASGSELPETKSLGKTFVLNIKAPEWPLMDWGKAAYQPALSQRSCFDHFGTPRFLRTEGGEKGLVLRREVSRATVDVAKSNDASIPDNHGQYSNDRSFGLRFHRCTVFEHLVPYISIFHHPNCHLGSRSNFHYHPIRREFPAANGFCCSSRVCLPSSGCIATCENRDSKSLRRVAAEEQLMHYEK